MQCVGTVQPERKMRHDTFETPLHWELFEKYNSFERKGKWYETNSGAGFRKCGSKHTLGSKYKDIDGRAR